MEKSSQTGSQAKNLFLKTAAIWVAIILLGSFWLTARDARSPVSLAVAPEAPRQGEPVLATFKLNNPGQSDSVLNYLFYVDGQLLREGQAALGPLASKTYQYAFSSTVPIGSRVSFEVKAVNQEGKTYAKTVSVPPFPPQVSSSFISFASFSTTVMSSMATSAYYRDNFSASGMGLNTGLIISLSLIALLIFLELAGAAVEEARGSQTGGIALVQRLKSRFDVLTWILLIIFLALVYTKVVMILSLA